VSWWWRDALCQEIGLETFFGSEDNQLTGYIHEAKKICATCPVRLECGRAAFTEEAGLVNLYGVRAGMSPAQRVRLYGHVCPTCRGDRDNKFYRKCSSCRAAA
jgi:hypothetical protein